MTLNHCSRDNRQTDAQWTRGWRPVVYVATSLAQQAQARAAAQEIARHGLEVAARWLDEPAETDLCHRDIALLDLDDIDRCHYFVLLVPEQGAGCYFEMGYAYARGKTVLFVGQHRIVFKALPNVRCFADLGSAIQFMLGGDGHEKSTDSNL